MRGLINHSDELRKLIIQQAEKYNIPFLHICKRVGVDYKVFLKGYANIKELRKAEVDINDSKLVEMAKLVGIDIRIVLVVKDDNKFADEALEIRKTLKNEYSNSKEKDNSPQA